MNIYIYIYIYISQLNITLFSVVYYKAMLSLILFISLVSDTKVNGMSSDSNTAMNDKWWEKESLIRFASPASLLLSGISQSGKTRFTFKLLENANGMFEKPPTKIIYAYGQYQPLFEQMEERIPGLILHSGIPSREQIDEWTDPTDTAHHTVIVLDDLAGQVTKSEEALFLFTVTAHHRCCSVIFLTQNLFMPGKFARSISLNCHYVVMFRSIRANSSLLSLASQAFPKQSAFIKQSYDLATSEPYTYLVIDMTANTPEKYRLRTRIFPGEDTRIYLPK